MHQAPVRGREEPVSFYAVPDPLAIVELADSDTGDNAIFPAPVV
jgi:hypothetical protein